jgi:hypothetical protein
MMMFGLKRLRVADQRLRRALIADCAQNVAGHGPTAVAHGLIAAARVQSANPLVVMARANPRHPIRRGQRGS